MVDINFENSLWDVLPPALELYKEFKRQYLKLLTHEINVSVAGDVYNLLIDEYTNKEYTTYAVFKHQAGVHYVIMFNLQKYTVICSLVVDNDQVRYEDIHNGVLFPAFMIYSSINGISFYVTDKKILLKLEKTVNLGNNRDWNIYLIFSGTETSNDLIIKYGKLIGNVYTEYVIIDPVEFLGSVGVEKIIFNSVAPLSEADKVVMVDMLENGLLTHR